MKSLLFTIFLTIAFLELAAQKCGSLYFSSGKKTIQLASYTRRGDDDGQIVYKISNISVKGNTSSSQINVQIFDKLQKLIGSNICNVKCNGNILLLDMKFFLPQQQIEQFKNAAIKEKAAFLEYPIALQPGDRLKDGIFEMEADKNGLELILKMEITERAVAGKEKVSTSAGAWDCFVIKSTTKLSIKTGPISIPIQFETTEWFNPSAGIIKTTNSTGYTEIVAIN
ncbi:hypothetical protein DC498_12385 [Terrimonas sp.]|uniref:TapB family protein n=1 Tax=Terrimonas sp. TaxID=1914338 RepID=UPI000D51C7E9|nr:hypothetical protein [Terrimonas sp.]PVD51843.1 hypothetical protein DC498_12385 [Terrimonas sp.]